MSKNNLKILTLKKSNVTDFALARNELLKKTDSEWVFFVDTDEKISKELKKEIESSINRKGYNGFYVYRKNYFLGRFIGRDKILRLGRKNFGIWERKVHEQWKVAGRVGTLDNFLIHNTANSLNEYIAKINRYAILHSEANRMEGKRSNFIKITLYPVLKFIQSVLMGRGVVFSILQAFHSFISWSNLWLAQKNET